MSLPTNDFCNRKSPQKSSQASDKLSTQQSNAAQLERSDIILGGGDSENRPDVVTYLEQWARTFDNMSSRQP